MCNDKQGVSGENQLKGHLIKRNGVSNDRRGPVHV